MTWEIREGDVRDRLREMDDGSVHCIVTSPPYWGLRDYGAEGQLGLEPTPEEYVATMVEVFREAPYESPYPVISTEEILGSALS